MQLNLKQTEKDLGIKILPWETSLGLDCSTRTGWCKATTTDKIIDLEYGFIKFNVQDRLIMYEMFLKQFEKLIQPNMKLVIEESFLGTNPKVFQLLSRIGMIAFIVGRQKNIAIDRISFLTPSYSRKLLGFKGNDKKINIHKQFLKQTKLQLTDPDIIDGIILSLCGLKI